MKTTQWLQTICSSHRSISHFIALLSELETIGAHKIDCSITEYGFGEPERLHYAEESGHAVLLRKILQKKEWVIEERALSDIREMAHDYFQPLDHGTSDHLSGLLGGTNPHLCYLLVSYLIECRAMEVYTDFERLCDDDIIQSMIRKVINDEALHLEAMRAQVYKTFTALGHDFHKEEFAALEERLYENLQRRFLEHMNLAAA